VFGHDCQEDGIAARRLIGYLPSEPFFPPKMTGRDVLDYTAALRGGDMDRAYGEQLIERLRLDPTRPVSALSRGNRQKVGIIQALLPRPALAILDEPTTGLDPLIQAETEAILRDVAADGRTVFFSSHILEEVETICSRAAVLRAGEIVDVFDLAEQRRLAPARVEVTFAEPAPADAFAGLPEGIRLMSQDAATAAFEVRADIDPLVKRLARHHVLTLVARQPTLEELFMHYYRDAGEGSSNGPTAEAAS
jgi:ABC-2 type transport system ATP-binding protein